MKMAEFYSTQHRDKRNEYLDYLARLGMLSGLFSDSDDPYLYYRAHENLFCKVFDANNLSRGDISYDAKVMGLGVGLKTFLRNNGATLQKVAEFDNDSDSLRKIEATSRSKEIACSVAEMRNKRLSFARDTTDCYDQLYHLVTRSKGCMNIYEYPMDYIDVDNIEILAAKPKNIRFTDGKNEYGFSLAKSTLYERFILREPLDSVEVKIAEDPFEILKSIKVDDMLIGNSNHHEHIYLPLYSTSDGQVPEKSQLNQWNAGGRARDFDEVYIPIPSEIYKLFPNFLPYLEYADETKSSKATPKFKVKLPDGNSITCKVAQSGGKALMSDPNKALGEWILRKVLGLRKGELLTREYLDKLGIDSVRLTKNSDEEFELDFAKTGSFEKFIKAKKGEN